jgi:organic hydroperoxide reductase OsmC/OhrA
MKNFPHRYSVVAGAHPGDDFELISRGLPPLITAAPAEFDGAGDRWSPETLLVGAVTACFILTFRAIARASKIDWMAVTCETAGRLERVDNVTQFTRFELHVRLSIPATTDSLRARHALERAERQCLVSNSLRATFDLRIDIDVAPSPEPALHPAGAS